MSWQGYPTPPPTVLDMGKGNWVMIVLTLVVCGGIGGVAVVSSIIGLASGGPVGGQLVGGAIGTVFLGIGVLPLIMYRRLTRPRRVIIDGYGVRWDDPKGAPWLMPWGDLAAVAVSTATKVSGVGSGLITRRTLVRIDLYPRDASVYHRHPEMRHLWGVGGVRNGYRLPLGPRGAYVPPLDAGLRTFGPAGVYRGVVDEGIALGFQYS
ncbi:hypothetical protein [Actinocatenispora rupis]|uniref:PH domain-containing protein n=1 Tax=Actinocatenispora rupis TaxID=519421 RepID=A0A8J3N8U5_9ACTN|nr:hypothetical protein [Actinocatenispora rupis]GID10461.1 hypothetical protein Aru02nite_13500 [Actinocatenispora rupis]